MNVYEQSKSQPTAVRRTEGLSGQKILIDFVTSADALIRIQTNLVFLFFRQSHYEALASPELIM